MKNNVLGLSCHVRCWFTVVMLLIPLAVLAQQEKYSEPDITNPGPDTPNFPTSPFTLPHGRVYIENFPLFLNIRGEIDPTSYQWPFLLRIGLWDCMELRLAGQGLTAIKAGDNRCSRRGFSPLIVGMKMHLWGDQDRLYLPSGGFECYVVTPLASPSLKEGSQIFFDGLFLHRFPRDWHLEWNAGFFTRRVLPHMHSLYFSLEWALQKEVTPNLEFFLEQSYTRSKLPWTKTNLLGCGLVVTLSKRICIYGSYNVSLISARQDLINIGFAVAF
jgi:hypothetical protein